MDFNTTIDLIIRELDETCEILEDLKHFQGTQAIEVELARSKCKNAAAAISLLKDWQGKTKQSEDINQYAGSQAKQEPKAADAIKPPVLQDIDEHNNVNEVNIEKTAGKSISGTDTEPGRSKETEADRPKDHNTGKPFVTPIIADNFSHLSRFNEQTGETQDYHHGKSITDLSEAIGLNDRFYFIREIFNNDREKYNKAIKELEGTKNIEEAKEIILHYSAEKRDADALKQFLDIVKRKFPK